MRQPVWRGVGLVVVAFLLGCARSPDPPAALAVSVPNPERAPDPPAPPAAEQRAPRRSASPPAAAASAQATRPQTPAERYPWLADPACAVPAAADSLDARFAPPPGFARVELAPGSFGAWLRALPLLAAGTSVLSFRGDVILPSDHENLAAVVALDVGARDLQQCADSVIRLHAEWLWATGRRDMSYRAAAGAVIPFERWARGERIVAQGNNLSWTLAKKPDHGHHALRTYLDAVFTWANTGSLARDTLPVATADLRPGDFVVQPGAPGHAVLVLDLARAPDGRRAVLLGQGFMPAQSFQVLRPSRRGAWFFLDDSASSLVTPFWAPFPWKTLRRFEGT